MTSSLIRPFYFRALSLLIISCLNFPLVVNAGLTEEQQVFVKTVSKAGYLTAADKITLKTFIDNQSTPQERVAFREELNRSFKGKTGIIVNQFLESIGDENKNKNIEAHPVVKNATSSSSSASLTPRAKTLPKKDAIKKTAASPSLSATSRAPLQTRTPVKVKNEPTAPIRPRLKLTVSVLSSRMNSTHKKLDADLFQAISYRQYNRIADLVEKGASPYGRLPVARLKKNDKDSIGEMSSLEFALDEYPRALDHFPQYQEKIKLGPEWLSLTHAVQRKNFEYARYLIEHDVRMKRGRTVYLAAISGDPVLKQTAEQIMLDAEQGTEKNRWEDNWSPLMVAAHLGDLDRVNAFLELGVSAKSRSVLAKPTYSFYRRETEDEYGDNALDLAIKRSTETVQNDAKKEAWIAIIRTLLAHDASVHKDTFKALLSSIAKDENLDDAISRSSLPIILADESHARLFPQHTALNNVGFVWSVNNNHVLLAKYFVERGLDYGQEFPALNDTSLRRNIFGMLYRLKKNHQPVYDAVVVKLAQFVDAESTSLDKTEALWDSVREGNGGWYFNSDDENKQFKDTIRRHTERLIHDEFTATERADLDAFVRLKSRYDKLHDKMRFDPNGVASRDNFSKLWFGLVSAQLEKITSLSELEAFSRRAVDLSPSEGYGRSNRHYDFVKALRAKELAMLSDEWRKAPLEQFPHYSDFKKSFKLEPIISNWDRSDALNYNTWGKLLLARVNLVENEEDLARALLTTKTSWKYDDAKYFKTTLHKRGAELFISKVRASTWASFEDAREALLSWQTQDLLAEASSRSSYYSSCDTPSSLQDIATAMCDHWFDTIVLDIEKATNADELSAIAQRLETIRADKMFTKRLKSVIEKAESAAGKTNALYAKALALFVQELDEKRIIKPKDVAQLFTKYQDAKLFPALEKHTWGSRHNQEVDPYIKAIAEHWLTRLSTEIVATTTLDDLLKIIKDADAHFYDDNFGHEFRNVLQAKENITAFGKLLNTHGLALYFEALKAGKWASFDKSMKAMKKYQEVIFPDSLDSRSAATRLIVEQIVQANVSHWFGKQCDRIMAAPTLDQLRGLRKALTNPERGYDQSSERYREITKFHDAKTAAFIARAMALIQHNMDNDAEVTFDQTIETIRKLQHENILPSLHKEDLDKLSEDQRVQFNELLQRIFAKWFGHLPEDIRTATTPERLIEIADSLEEVNLIEYFPDEIIKLNADGHQKDGHVGLLRKRALELFTEQLNNGTWATIDETLRALDDYHFRGLMPADYLRGHEHSLREGNVLWEGVARAIFRHWFPDASALIAAADSLERLGEIREQLMKLAGRDLFDVTLVHELRQIFGDGHQSGAFRKRGVELFLIKLEEDPWPSFVETMEALHTCQREMYLPEYYMMQTPTRPGGCYQARIMIGTIHNAIAEQWFATVADDIDEAEDLDRLAEIGARLEHARDDAEFLPIVLKLLRDNDDEKGTPLSRYHKTTRLFFEKLATHSWPTYEEAVRARHKFERMMLLPDASEMSTEGKALRQSLGKAMFEAYAGTQPTIEAVIDSLRHNLGSAHPDYDAAIRLKRLAWESGLVETTEQYIGMMGDVTGRSFNHNPYLRTSSKLLVDTVQHFADTRTTARELLGLRGFVHTLRMHHDFSGQRENLVLYIELRLVERKEAAPIQAYETLHKNVRALYEQKKEEEAETEAENAEAPRIDDPQSKCKYYLIRNAQECAADRRMVNDGACATLWLDVDEDHPARACTYHDEDVLFHVKGHDGCKCLAEMIRAQIQDGKYPLTCQTPHAPHELLLTDDELKHEGLNTQEIYELKIHTLLAYYRELGGSEINPYKICPSNFCIQPIFASQIDKAGNFVCPTCEEEYCYECEGAPHTGMSCDERNRADWHDVNSLLRPCPWCFKPFAKDTACNHVWCGNPACMRSFHFVKGKYRVNSNNCHSYNPKDAAGKEVVPAREYLIPGEPGYAPGKESAYPESDGDFAPLR